MANIAIINYCNLKCEYCFAEDFKQQELYQITFEDYQKLFEFATDSQSCKKIGIIGGEPTLHSEIKSILSYTDYTCFEKCIEAVLFTNGIELESCLNFIGNNISLLINVNSPSIMTQNQWNKLNKNLDTIFLYSPLWRRCTLGCNIHLNCKNYQFIWDIVDKYHLPAIRCSVVSPGGCYLSWRNKNKQDYYNLLKPIFLNFCEKAKEHNCLLNMDCNKIPICYFNQEELELVYSVCVNYETLFCDPVIDLIGNNEAISCFGANNPIDITKFRNIDEINRYLLLDNYNKISQRINEEQCCNCNLFELKQCQGGCLSFNK